MLALLLLLLPLTLAACTGRDIGGVASGWNALTVADGVVYVGDENGRVHALEDGDSDVPRTLWSFPATDSGVGDLQGVFSAPLVTQGMLFVTAEDGFVYALDPETGNQGWQRPRGQQSQNRHLVAGPAYDRVNNLVLVPSVEDDDSGKLYGYVADSGEEIWDAPFETDDKIWSTPAVGLIDGRAMAWFGSHDHHVYAVNVSSGQEIWKYQTGGVVAGRPLLLNDLVIVGSFDKNLYALDARDGSVQWQFEGGNWFWAGAVSNGRDIFAPSMDGHIYALSRDGALRWQYDSGAAVVSRPALVPAGVVAANRNGEIILLDAASGEEIRKLALGRGAEIIAPLYAAGESVFVSSRDGNVYRVDATARRPLEVWWCWHPENDNNRCN